MVNLKDVGLLNVGNTVQLVGAVYQGQDRTYLCLFPEDKNDLPLEVLHMDAEDWKAFLRQTDLLETEVLTKATDGTLAKAILRKSQRQIDQNVSWAVFRRDEYACRYCGADDVPLTVDHLVRWEDGGPSVEGNLVSSCRKCNRIRGDQSYPDWLASPYYKKVSAGLDDVTKTANVALVATLDKIPRQLHTRSR